MNYRKSWIVAFLTLMTLFSFSHWGAAQQLKIRVKAENASLRLKAEFKSQVLMIAPKGAVFDVLEQTGEWYLVKYTPEDSPYEIAGYLHMSEVEVLTQEQPALQRPPAASAPAAGKLPPDLERMQRIEKSLRRSSLAFLSLIKKMDPEETSGYQAQAADMVRVVIDGCNVYETKDRGSQVIYTPRINDEFEVLDRSDSLYHIQLPDGREGWISEECIQPFSAQTQRSVIRFRGVSPNEIKNYLDMATDIFASITQQKQAADQLYKKNQGKQLGQDLSFQAAYLKIQKYYSYAREFYGRFVDNKLFETKGATLLSRLSAWTELLLGRNAYQTEYLNEDPVNQKGFVYDISAGGELTLNSKSRVSVRVSRKSDIIQTPFSTLTMDAGYTYRDSQKLTFRIGANLNTYNDKLSDFSDYKRITLRSDIDFQLSPKARVLVNYAFLRNDFSLNSDNSYNNHSILAASKWKSGSRSEITLQMRSSFQSSQSDLYNFTDLEPSLSFDRYGTNSRLTVSALYDMFSYSDLKLRSYNRAVFQIMNQARSRDISSRWNLAVISKDYPDNQSASYIQLQGGFIRTKSGRLGMRIAPSFTTNLFKENSANNFTDIRLDLSSTASAFFVNLSSFLRLWHSPGNPDVENAAVKPHVVDVYGQLGLNLKYIKIGPTFGLHALFSSETGVEFFKRDGNLIRVGGVVEGNIPFPSGIYLTLKGSYQYGFVYNNEIDIDVNTGDITTGDLLMRHPTTFQIQSALQVPLFQNIMLLGRANYYIIASDMDEKLSIRPITQNTRFIAQVGIRYRFN
jgi:hypothetical protein